MLQRIQTVFLFVIAVLMVLFQVFPGWINMVGDGMVYRLYPLFFYSLDSETSTEVVVYMPFIVSGVLAALSAIVAIIEIFSYNNRLTQIKLGALNSLLMAGALISIMYFISDLQKNAEDLSQDRFGIGLMFPAIAMLFNIMANRFIRKDEKLVRSMDRIR